MVSSFTPNCMFNCVFHLSACSRSFAHISSATHHHGHFSNRIEETRGLIQEWTRNNRISCLIPQPSRKKNPIFISSFFFTVFFSDSFFFFFPPSLSLLFSLRAEHKNFCFVLHSLTRDKRERDGAQIGKRENRAKQS